MAIDARISLAAQQPTPVGDIFRGILQNIGTAQQQDITRGLAPLQQEQAQMQVDLMKAQQPAQLLAAERAASTLTQAQQDLTQEQQLGVQIAQSLKPLLDSNNTLGVVAELTRLNQERPELRLTDEIELIQRDPQAFKVMNESILKLGGVGDKKDFAPQISPVQIDPETGQKFIIKTDRNTGESARVDVKGAKGRTPEQKEQAAIRASLLDDAAKVSKESFDQLSGVRSAISTIDEAITAIDQGASSGAISKFFPSFRESTIALENAAQRMGLDVISATTFGALSEGELKLAMDTAMPKNLNPKNLKKWLSERKDAKLKLSRELTKMAITLGKGKTTIAEYLEKNATFDERSDQDIFAEYGL